MRLQNILALALFAVFIMQFSTAAPISDPSWFKGDASISSSKLSFRAGETLTAQINTINLDTLPVAEGIIVVEIAKGKDFYYPSSLNDNDNVIFEQEIKGINLRPGETKSFDFSYKIPEDLSSGDYRVDVYFKALRSPIVGLSNIFMTPKTLNFTVSNSSKNSAFPQLKILRTKTEFRDSEDIITASGSAEPSAIGPIGAPTKPGAAIFGKVYLQNTSNTELKNVEVFAGLCEWDESLCNGYLSEAKVSVASIPANSEKLVELQLKAPTNPTAYAIRIEARQNGRLLSLYRNRAVVVGGSARVRKLYSESVELEAGKEAKFHAMISPSADHWLMPAFKNFKLVFTMQDLETGQQLINETVLVQEIKYDSDFVLKDFSTTPAKNILKYKLCARIEKSGSILDNYCVVYDSTKFTPLVQQVLELNWKRTQGNTMLNLEFCTSPKDMLIKANYQLLGESFENFVASENIEGTECIKKIIPVDSGKKYALAVTDYLQKRQKIYEIGFTEENNQQGPCKGSRCIEVQNNFFSGGLFVLLIEALFLVIIALIVFSIAVLLKKKKRKGAKK